MNILNFKKLHVVHKGVIISAVFITYFECEKYARYLKIMNLGCNEFKFEKNASNNYQKKICSIFNVSLLFIISNNYHEYP